MTLPNRQSAPVTASAPGGLVCSPDEVVCHCLHVTASAIDVAITVDRCRTVRDIVGTTEAGGGCTACHRRIRDILARRV